MYPHSLVVICKDREETESTYLKLSQRYDTADATMPLLITGPIEIHRSYLLEPVSFVLTWTDLPREDFDFPWVVYKPDDPFSTIQNRVEDRRMYQLETYNMLSTMRLTGFSFDLVDNGAGYYAMVHQKGYIDAHKLILAEDREEVLAKVKGLWKQYILAMGLSRMFPHIQFIVCSETIGAWVKHRAVHTGINISNPPLKKEIELLRKADPQAALAQQEGYKYCTHCRTAKPAEEHFGYTFAESICKECQEKREKKYKGG